MLVEPTGFAPVPPVSRPISRPNAIRAYPRPWERPTPTSVRLVAKRVLDILVATVCLVLAVPLLITAAIWVKLDSPGPVLFRQRRVGRDGQVFEMLKLRTMTTGADDLVIDLVDQNDTGGPLFKMRDDPRITRAGRLLRRTSMDELPQLVNVLNGEMSIVGPRPALPREVQHWEDPLFDRLRVKPGITGLWQVSGRSSLPYDDYVRFDLDYVQNWTLTKDLVIILRTVPAVLSGRGAF